jgi:hypothetical protein
MRLHEEVLDGRGDSVEIPSRFEAPQSAVRSSGWALSRKVTRNLM